MWNHIKESVLHKKAELLCVILASGLLAVVFDWLQNSPYNLVIKLVPIIILGIVAFYVQQILPVRIYEERGLGVLAFDYLIWSLFLEIIFFFISLKMTADLYISSFSLPFFILSQCLFFGFICAAEREVGLWQGIKQVFVRHFWKMVCLIAVLRVLRKLSEYLFAQLAWARGLWEGLLYVAVVYVLIAWMKWKK